MQQYDLLKLGYQYFKRQLTVVILVFGLVCESFHARGQRISLSLEKDFILKDGSETKSIFSDDGSLHLSGLVLNPITEKPIRDVEVILQLNPSPSNSGHNKNNWHFNSSLISPSESLKKSFAVSTNSKGQFKLVVPAVELADYGLFLKLKATGYNDYIIYLNPHTPGDPIIHYLSPLVPEVKQGNFNNNPVSDYFKLGEDRFRSEMNYSSYNSFYEDDYSPVKTEERKGYRTRAGILIKKAFYPFRKLKRLIKNLVNHEE